MSTERGSILFKTGRFELAEQEFRAALAEDSSNGLAHCMLGMCLSRRKEYEQATEEANEAIRLRPDWHFGYSVLAYIMLDRDRLKQAAEAIGTAIALDPFNAEYHGTLAGIRLQQRQWSAALASADAGLQIDPGSEYCLNCRAQAMVKLGLRDAAAATIDGALQQNPDNPLTHANQGWALLHAGKHREALVHFREALRLKPGLEWARAGLVEALQARNPIYRVMLKYFLFMARLQRGAQWGIIVGGYLGCRLLIELKDDHPQWAAWIWPLIILYSVFAIMTWIARPLFNLLLRLSPYGRYALSRDQTMGANMVGGAILAAIVFAAAGFLRADFLLICVGVACGLMALPISTIFICPAGWPRRSMAAYTLLVGIVGISAAVLWALARRTDAGSAASLMDVRDRLLPIFAFGVFLNGWVANALIAVRVKK